MHFIGIAGSSGSGKTSVARELEALLPDVGTLCTDSYYNDLSAMDVSARSAVNYDSPDAIDWELLTKHVRELRSDGSVLVPKYDFATHARKEAVQVFGPWETVILEGLFALWHPSIREALDLAVFVDTPQSTCLDRRIARDTRSRGRTEESVREQWQRDVIPMFRLHAWPTCEFADLVIDGGQPPAESAAAVRAALAEGRVTASVRSNR